MFALNKETISLIGVVIAFLGVLYLFREIRKLRQLIASAPSVAPVREAPKVVQFRKPVAQPIQKARIVEEEEEDEASEEEED
jgi:hypothetical protein